MKLSKKEEKLLRIPEGEAMFASMSMCGDLTKSEMIKAKLKCSHKNEIVEKLTEL